MGKPRKYSNELLNELVDLYIDGLVDGEILDYQYNPRTIAEYWDKHGYPGIDANQFQRYAKERIDGIKALLIEDEITHFSEDEENLFVSFDYAQFYEINKAKTFCGLDKIADVIEKARKQIQAKTKKVTELKKERANLSDEVLRLRKENEKLDKDNKKLRVKNAELVKENADLKETDNQIVAELYKGFSEIVRYRDEEGNGRTIVMNDYLRGNSYLGNDGKETPSANEIEETYIAHNPDGELIDAAGKISSAELLRRIRKNNDSKRD